jgi:putative transposase
MQLIPTLPENLSLERLIEWLDGDYHKRVHSATGQSPLDRYLASLSLVRAAPKDLRDYFRLAVRRKVAKDRTVTLAGRSFEAPVGLIGQTVTLLYHERDIERVEIFMDDVSKGFLVRRSANLTTEIVPSPPPPPELAPRSGSLFGSSPSAGASS